jgi:hypothetical protein
MKQLIVMLAVFLASINVAYGYDYYDFEYNDLYYTIISNEYKTVSVSAYEFFNYDNSNNKIFELTIPQCVSNNGTIYTVTDVGSFRNSEELTSVTIPSSVTSIGAQAFYGCTGLTSVSIPSSVTSINDYAFCECTGLKKVSISDMSAWCNISFRTSDANPLVYAQHLYLNDEEVKDLVIPEDVTRIKDYIFYGCTGLTTVSIPPSVTYIGYHAFEGCTKLTSVNIPSSVTSIASNAFRKCSDCA